MPVIKYDQNYPKDLKAMTPSAFNDPDSINPVPENPGTEGAYDPTSRTRTDLWPQCLINLKDVDGNNWWTNAGKMLMVRRDGSPSPEGYNVEYGYPDQLQSARNFSIDGDGTAPAVAFDGTVDVVLQLTDVEATSLKNARGFSLTGDIVADEIMFDATGNVVLITRYENVIPDDKLPNWITVGFADLSTRVDQLEITVSNNYITLTNKINAVDARVTTVDNRVTSINTSTQTQITNLSNQIGTNTAAINSVSNTVISQGNAIAELQAAASGPIGEIGAYAMLRLMFGGAVSGQNISSDGELLRYSSATGPTDNVVPAGQIWQCCGSASETGTAGDQTTLWRRIS